MVIQHNLSAMNANRQLGINNSGTKGNLEKLSSGYRVNRAADDAAGLAISEKMRGQIRGLDMAATNANNGISLIQTAEGGLQESHAIMQRMRELAVQASNGTYDDTDRAAIGKEVQALKSELDRIASSTNYNGISLLDGTLGGQDASKLPGSPEGTAAQNTYDDGSLGALGSYLIDMGFQLFPMPSSGHIGILGNIGLSHVDSSLDGQSANIVLVQGRPSLQVGDKTYVSEYDTLNSVYNFLDENGVTVAKLNANYDEIQGNKNGIIKNIKLGTGSTQIFTADGDAGILPIPSTHPLAKAFLNGESGSLVFQIGANGTADQKVWLHVENMSSAALGDGVATTYNRSGTVAEVKVNPREAANEAVALLDIAINQVSSQRAGLGALQNRLEHTVNNLGVTHENLQAAESSIRDVDMAKEMMEFTKNNILSQASQSMLAQANQLPQGVLQLLR